MIDAPVTVSFAPAADVLALDLWDSGVPPADSALRLLHAEPRRWWVIGAGDAAEALAAAVGERGALTPIGGGLVRATLAGPGWRWLLSVSGWLDTADPAFGKGLLVGSVIHHVPVWIDAIGDDACEVYLPSSYAATLADLWQRAIGVPGG
ncbi:sarcosine oxidase subunit gamma [Sphingomonas sp. PAMC 26605]|uniref:sarcosine oxidase subunit gamma n=1 Tax=Sphingomonas sp. PAMC 26605 TaxID=1112214 RepID=UPI00026CDE0C|nr:sarcosine oxidase subunit gamma [Sphingomonas sp. PAMC 26605]